MLLNIRGREMLRRYCRLEVELVCNLVCSQHPRSQLLIQAEFDSVNQLLMPNQLIFTTLTIRVLSFSPEQFQKSRLRDDCLGKESKKVKNLPLTLFLLISENYTVEFLQS